jgi:hypothetical protein
MSPSLVLLPMFKLCFSLVSAKDSASDLSLIENHTSTNCACSGASLFVASENRSHDRIQCALKRINSPVENRYDGA